MNSIPPPIRILIADDHPLMRDGIRTTLERRADMRVIAEACDGEEVVAQFRLHRPDVVIMDLCMPRMNGLQAIAAIHAEQRDAPIVVLTTYPGDARVSRALKAGAISYLLKTAHPEQIFAAVLGALAGETVLGDNVATERVNTGRELLSCREVSVLRLVAQGARNSDIGRQLNITEHTVKSRVGKILLKLNAKDRAHAASLARIRGFID
jgi:DNA-binding NarL/FixJ family response regulator